MSSVCAAPASFPQELIDKIIDELVSINRSGALRHDSREALVACSLASHSFRPRAIRHLFRRFCPADMTPVLESRGWERLDEMLSRSPLIARSFTSIILQSEGSPPAIYRAQAVHIMSLLVHVKSVEVWGTALAHWRPTISGVFADMPLTRVLFASVPFSHLNHLVSCLAQCFPHPENLEFRGCEFDFTDLMPSSESQETAVLSLDSLETLTCSVSDMGSFFDGIEAKNLRTLKLSCVSMSAACFAPLLQKSPLRALDMADVKFDDSPRNRDPTPLALRHLETLCITYAYFKWLCDSIPLGMPQLQTVTVRFFGQYHGTTPSVFKLFDDLATTYLPELKIFRLVCFEEWQSTIIKDCPGLERAAFCRSEKPLADGAD
ncbi:hypothetical protein BDZ89DRAFT_1070156, partial [Hymenopellis radicata]